MSNPRLTVIDAGLMAYDACLALQQRLHAQVVDSLPAGRDGYLVLVQHPPVLTLGKHADPAHLLLDTAELAARGVAVVPTDRGGEVTAHMPGQLVAYPILPLGAFNLGPRRLVAVLEGAVTGVLADFGVAGESDPDHPGVWVKGAKIAAVGVRIKDRVSMHGLAFNVQDDLSLFSAIVPCGIKDRGVTSLSRLARQSLTPAAVAPRLVAALARGLGLPEEAIIAGGSLPECSSACNVKKDSLQFEL